MAFRGSEGCYGHRASGIRKSLKVVQLLLVQNVVRASCGGVLPLKKAKK